MKGPARILLTGATGYVGGRLLPLLLEGSASVRCLVRRAERLSAFACEALEIVEADLLDLDSLGSALENVDVAFYLVHSMGGTENFEERDRRAALHFAEKAAQAQVKRIIYLGGLGDEQMDLSPHLRSRQEVGRCLASTGVQVIELRASIILGAGSLSFELIRALVECLPIMVTPKWVHVLAQPIAIQDVLEILLQCMHLELQDPWISIEIGGPEQCSYGEIMHQYAMIRALKRWMIPVPFLTPRLSSLWLGLVTPVYARIGKSLIQSLKYPTLVRSDLMNQLFKLQPLGVRDALIQALRREDQNFVLPRWNDAMWLSQSTESTWGGQRLGNRLFDLRQIEIRASAAEVFAVVEQIGGKRGWYHANFLWRIRGWIDLCLGGVGMRRGRRDAQHLAVGDVLDCWRVLGLEQSQTLLLEAEMKLPGRGWLRFQIEQKAKGVQLTQCASFDPLGLWGILYWWSVWPLHQWVFEGMIRAIRRRAESIAAK